MKKILILSIFCASLLLAFVPTTFTHAASSQEEQLKAIVDKYYEAESLEVLLQDARLELKLIEEQKNAETAAISIVQQNITKYSAQFTAQQKIVTQKTKAITTFKAKNKNIAKGTKAQKEKYRTNLKKLQDQLNVQRTKATNISKQVKAEQSKLQALKKQYTLIHNETSAITKHVATLQKNLTQLVRDRKALVATYEKAFGKVSYDKNLNVPKYNFEKLTINAVNVNATKLTATEQALATAINDYRKEQGLKPLTISKSLTKVARTHVNDQNVHKNTTINVECTPYSWSKNVAWTDGCYTAQHFDGDQKFYQIMTLKPQELTKYKGNGIELYAWNNGEITVEQALAKFKETSRDSYMLKGEGYYRNVTTMGVAINGHFAYVWLGMENDPAGYYKY